MREKVAIDELVKGETALACHGVCELTSTTPIKLVYYPPAPYIQKRHNPKLYLVYYPRLRVMAAYVLQPEQ
jgi:hypothetical protein